MARSVPVGRLMPLPPPRLLQQHALPSCWCAVAQQTALTAARSTKGSRGCRVTNRHRKLTFRLTIGHACSSSVHLIALLTRQAGLRGPHLTRWRHDCGDGGLACRQTLHFGRDAAQPLRVHQHVRRARLLDVHLHERPHRSGDGAALAATPSPSCTPQSSAIQAVMQWLVLHSFIAAQEKLAEMRKGILVVRRGGGGGGGGGSL